MRTAAGALTAALRSGHKKGTLSSGTESPLRHEFRRRGWGSADVLLAAPLTLEITWLEREATTLRRLRDTLFGIA
jgi:hypothetical protein